MAEEAPAPRLGPNYAIRDLFCAQCQQLRPLVFLVVGQELVASCKCGRAIKWPLSMSKEELMAAFIEHLRRNRGQIPASFGSASLRVEQRNPLMDAVEQLPEETT